MNLKKLFLSITIVALMLVIPSMILAQDAAVGSSSSESERVKTGAERRQEIIESRSQASDDRIIQRCERISERIDLILEKYTQNKDRHADKYDQITNRVTGLLEKLENSDYDTSEVKAALSRLEAAKADFQGAFSGFASGMETAKANACSDRESEFVDSIAIARNELKSVQEEARELYKVAGQDLRAALQSLKDQAKTNDPDTGSEDGEVVNPEVENN